MAKASVVLMWPSGSDTLTREMELPFVFTEMQLELQVGGGPVELKVIGGRWHEGSGVMIVDVVLLRDFDEKEYRPYFAAATEWKKD